MFLKGTPCFGLHEKFMYLVWNEPENHVRFEIVHAVVGADHTLQRFKPCSLNFRRLPQVVLQLLSQQCFCFRSCKLMY